MDQFGNPHGLLGWIAGRLMANLNRRRMDAVVEALQVQPGDNILEIGCGPGLALCPIVSQLGTGHLSAIDRSTLMIGTAAKRVKEYTGTDKLTLRAGSLEQMDFALHQFNKIFAVNVVHFWQNPVKELQTIRKNLAPNGNFYIFHQPPVTRDKDLTISFAGKTSEEVQLAGFRVKELKYLKVKPVLMVCIICAPE